MFDGKCLKDDASILAGPLGPNRIRLCRPDEHTSRSNTRGRGLQGRLSESRTFHISRIGSSVPSAHELWRDGRRAPATAGVAQNE